MHLLSWPTISELIARNEPLAETLWDRSLDSIAESPTTNAGGWQKQPITRGAKRVRAEQQWQGAIAALEQLLLQLASFSTLEDTQAPPDCAASQGVMLAGPSAILSHLALMQKFQSWIFSSEGSTSTTPLLSANDIHQPEQVAVRTLKSLPLLPADPLAGEPFCLVLTQHFGLVMALGENAAGDPAFLFSFEPDTVQAGWQLLQPRVMLSSQGQVEELSAAIAQFPPPEPTYRLVMQFSRLLLQHLPDWTELTHEQPHNLTASPQPSPRPKPPTARGAKDPVQHSSNQRSSFSGRLETLSDATANSLDIELLQAVAHEVRTPLTTIRTLTRLLLKHKTLAPTVKKRLDAIDRECTEQIDRFGLIFRAVELETAPVKHPPVCLTATSLDKVLQHSIPRWQQQASRHNLSLDVSLPKQLPMVVSDPVMLDQVLMGLIETFTRNLPGGSYIRVQVMLAGDQLKLQLQSRSRSEDNLSHADETSQSHFAETAKPIGQILMFQPETGSLSLNLAVTKQLFQALGGRLIVRQRPNQGKVMTIFLPLELSSIPS